MDYFIKNIINYEVRIVNVMRIISIVVALSYLCFSNSNISSIIFTISIVLFILLLLIINILPYLIDRLIAKIDIDSYERYLIQLYPMIHKRNIYKNYALFRLSEFAYLCGNFEESIAYLKEVDIDQLSILKYGGKSKLDYYLQAFKIRTAMNDLSKLENIKLQLMMQTPKFSIERSKKLLYLNYCEFYNDICIKHIPNDMYKQMPSNNFLNELQKKYFMAKFYKLKGDSIEVERLFLEISKNDKRLFMVREAKEWLDKMKAD
ncbi:hypothetical protein MKL26_07000 [Streptococcus suis]|nr:hypothetical protein [Streptococcus suis]